MTTSKKDKPLTNGTLLKYRVTQLEQNFTSLRELLEKTHEQVTQIVAKIGSSFTFQCNVHSERMTNMDGRISRTEQRIFEINKELDSIKKLIWKGIGGLIAATFIVQVFLAPLASSWLHKADSHISAPSISFPNTVTPNNTNLFIIP